MAKFLGSGGVQYLWTKAKKTFYENGNDITLKNGKKISVLAGDGTSTSNETVITSDGVTVGAVKNDMSDPYIGYKNAIDKDGLHIYGVDQGGNQDANERVDITSSGVKYSGAQGNGRTLKLGFEGIGFPRLVMDGNPGESKSVKIDFNDVIIQNESTTHKLSNKVDKVEGKGLIDENVANNLSGSSAAIQVKKGVELKSNGSDINGVHINDSSVSIAGGDSGNKYVSITSEDVTINETGQTSHKLSNKVDKVEGKSLIDNEVAKYITYNTEDDSLHIDKLRHVNVDDSSFVTDFSGKLEFRTFLTLPNNNTSYDYDRLTLDHSGLKLRSNYDQNTDVINISADGIKVSACSGQSNQSIVVNAPLGEIELINDGKTHKLSEKADKTYVDSLKPVTFTVSVPTTGWSTLTDSNGETYYKLTITASNAISTGYPVCDVVLPDDIAAARLQENAYKCINKVSVGSGNVTLYCFEEIPSVAFTIRIQIARS